MKSPQIVSHSRLSRHGSCIAVHGGAPLSLLVGLLALMAAAAVPSSAQSVPTLINYQGQLQTASGTNPPTADYTMAFSIYDAPTGGNLIWGPQIFDGQATQGRGPKIPIVKGYFNVVLGPEDTAGRNISDAFASPTRYVQISVGTNPPITPRQRFLTSPYAYAALRSEVAAFAADVANGAVTPAKLAAEVAEGLAPAGAVTAFAGTNSASPPVGWLFCDGRAVSRSTYAALFVAIGTAHGAGDGVTTFNLPDYRWTFLRGYGPNITAVGTGSAANNQATFAGHGFNRSGLRVRLSSGALAGLSGGTDYWAIVVDSNTLAFASTRSNAVSEIPVRLPLSGVNSATIVQWEDPDVSLRELSSKGASSSSGLGSFQPDMFRSHAHGGVMRVTSADPASDGGGGWLEINFDYAGATAASGGNETRPQNRYVNYLIKY